MSQRVCVILSGCGFLDGAEVHESVITLLALSKAGAQVTIAAPNIDQHHVINHHNSTPMEGETRNVQVEAARIARGPVADLNTVKAIDFDALFMPGGFGAAENLSSFAFEGSSGSILPELKRIIQEFHSAKKPIGAVCITPALLALSLKDGTMTIGSDEGTAGALNTLGATHQVCPVTEAVVDSDNKLVTAPAYMENAAIHEVAAGIEAAVEATLGMC